MASGIESVSAERDDLQAQYRGLPERTDEETEALRGELRARLTDVEKRLEKSLEDRIALSDEAIKGLEEMLPGFSPGPPVAPASTPATDQGGRSAYTVQSELYRLERDKQADEAHLLQIERCLARKRIREIEAEIPTLPIVATGEREMLLKEKAEAVEYLKSTASNVSCIKPSSQTVHPTEVSQGQLEKIKIGEGWVPTAYVALEGQKKESGGCTIGYGHVITSKESSCVHGPKPPEIDNPTVQKKPLWPCVCDNADWQAINKTRGEEILKNDLKVETNWIKEHILVDLDQGQFDALVDIAAHVGSVPSSLIDIIHKKICTDDEAVRQAYMKTALYTKDRPELGPVFGKRRKERVWAPKSDDDPGCI
jgi:GH24 family phage-related lysozyme (muramidase)